MIYFTVKKMDSITTSKTKTRHKLRPKQAKSFKLTGYQSNHWNKCAGKSLLIEKYLNNDLQIILFFRYIFSKFFDIH